MNGLLALVCGRPQFPAWGVVTIVATYYGAIEHWPLPILGWIVSGLALPWLHASARKTLRGLAWASTVALSLYSLAAIATIASEGAWHHQRVVALVLSLATLVASAVTYLVARRGRASSLERRSKRNMAVAASRAIEAQRADTPQPKIFVSYRRTDSQWIVDRMAEHLAEVFPRENLFRDIESIPKGVDFRFAIEKSVTRCDVLLAVIGPHWLNAADDSGNRRLDDPMDSVRSEIESALRRNIPVIPVLLADTSIPKAERLPESIRDLAYRNGSRVRHDPDFANDIQLLVKDVRGAVASIHRA